MVDDRSDFHNFHLSGPGVSLATDVEAVEKVTWDVDFVEGRYTFVCDPHATQMKGAFTVGNPPPPPVPDATRRDGRPEQHDHADAQRRARAHAARRGRT